jgi:hypothetical protein
LAQRVATSEALPVNPIKMEISGCRRMRRRVCVLPRDEELRERVTSSCIRVGDRGLKCPERHRSTAHPSSKHTPPLLPKTQVQLTKSKELRR